MPAVMGGSTLSSCAAGDGGALSQKTLGVTEDFARTTEKLHLLTSDFSMLFFRSVSN
jgi:hypothetical protein